jgi:hypothetical protein
MMWPFARDGLRECRTGNPEERARNEYEDRLGSHYDKAED